MEKKKNLTVEELTKACAEAESTFEALKKQLKQAKQEEEERKRAELALVKESRKKEVDAAFDKWLELHQAYLVDYGDYVVARNYRDKFPWHLFWN